jgi:hypothetical protein
MSTGTVMFRDWLRGKAADRDRYARSKLTLAQQEWNYVQNCAFIEESVARARVEYRTTSNRFSCGSSVHDFFVVQMHELVKALRLSRTPLLTDADDGHHAATLGALLAVAEEEVGAAGGAEVADEDVLRAEAEGQELGAIGFP